MSAGRPTGASNKNKAYLMNRLKDMYGDDFDPIIRMAEQATRLHAAAIDAEDTRPLKESIDAWDKIAQYIQPKLKAIEIDGSVAVLTHEEWLKTLSTPEGD